MIEAARGVLSGFNREMAVQKVREFRHRAKECRELSAKAGNTDLKTHYEEMDRIYVASHSEYHAQERLLSRPSL
jgi:hypothetical protein